MAEYFGLKPGTQKSYTSHFSGTHIFRKPRETMIRLTRLALFYLCSISAIAVEGFHVGGTFRLKKSFSVYAGSETTNMEPSKPDPAMEETAVMEPKLDATPTAVSATTAALSTVDAGTMDEGIYKFNKQLIDTVYDVICFLYPVKGNERDFARFFVLETVARVPYFAYLSCLHLQETFGVRYPNMSDRMRTHYAEADNELHHLLIQESLGGNSNPVDRVLAQTMAFFYYWYVIVIYTWNEPAAYHLSELIEDHAFDTYSNFLKNHETFLKSKPVPEIARKYYEEENPFLFELYCTVKDDPECSVEEQVTACCRRPDLETLYDVFVCIRDDEKEHWKTLCNLVQFDEMNAVAARDVKSTVPAPAESA
mmetsp:Transcript_20562/g.50472  ORF Transcript_20562/g.50472 Transcript_20562/m.50472 type:complete len:366 (+) Transcript_20562:167-1264(+)